MSKSAGAKQRVMSRCEYRPALAWGRDSRIIGKNGTNQTFKKKGDIIIDSQGRKVEVTKDGWE